MLAEVAAVLRRAAGVALGLPARRAGRRRRARATSPRELYGDDDPLASPTGDGPFRIARTDRGAVLRLALPFVSRADVDLARNGDELVVTVGSYRRLLTLPAGLARLPGRRARAWSDGELQVRFEEEEQT